MPVTSTTSSWLFPPQTREVQFDEKWSFVGKKDKHCDPANDADAFRGDCWDWVAFDPEHRLVVSVIPGKRTPEHAEWIVTAFRERTGGRIPIVMTSDENPAYAAAILAVYGEEVVPERTGRPGRPAAPYRAIPEGLQYATVHKVREANRVVEVQTRVVYGTAEGVTRALEDSAASSAVNTAFVERHHGTDRNRNARKVRKTYCFSKDWEVHAAVTYFTMYSYNFCWPVRTLRQGNRRTGYQPRTPAMAAGLTDHVWSLAEWLTCPAFPRMNKIPNSG